MDHRGGCRLCDVVLCFPSWLAVVARLGWWSPTSCCDVEPQWPPSHRVVGGSASTWVVVLSAKVVFVVASPWVNFILFVNVFLVVLLAVNNVLLQMSEGGTKQKLKKQNLPMQGTI